jgi:butyrate kinase
MTGDQMAVSTAADEEFVVLIEWPGAQPGVVKASRGERLKVMQEQSQKALNLAMGTIRAMAYRVAKTIGQLEDMARPDEAEVEFGITLDAEAGAMLAKASTGAQIKVKLKWTIEQPHEATVLVTE